MAQIITWWPFITLIIAQTAGLATYLSSMRSDVRYLAKSMERVEKFVENELGEINKRLDQLEKQTHSLEVQIAASAAAQATLST